MIPHASDRPSRFEPALRLAIQGRWADAVRSVVQAVAAPEAEAEHGDEASDALGEVARLAVDAVDLEAADQALVAALLIRPHHADRLHQSAVVRFMLGDRVEARALLERALRVEPRHVGARLELSMLETRDGRLGEAVAGLRALDREGPALDAGREPLTASPSEPGDAGLHEDVASVRRDLDGGRFEAAARRLDAMLEKEPARAELHALRAAVEAGQGALDDAISSCGRALELDPDDLETRTRLARTLENLGLRDQALEQIGRVLARSPGHRDARTLHERWSAARRRGSARENHAPKGS